MTYMESWNMEELEDDAIERHTLVLGKYSIAIIANWRNIVVGGDKVRWYVDVDNAEIGKGESASVDRAKAEAMECLIRTL